MTKAMVLAAGRGTRLKELTANTPKPLVPVAGIKPLLRSINLLHKAGYTEVCVNAYYLADQVVSAVKNIQPKVTPIVEEGAFDNGGGVKNALSFLGKAPFIAINGDLIWSEETQPILKELPTFFDEERMDGLLLLVHVDNTRGYQGTGNFMVAEDGALKWPQEEEKAVHVYTGIQILHPRIFAPFAGETNFSLLNVYKEAIKKNRLYGHVYHGTWADMGTPVGLKAAAELVSSL